MTEIVLGIKLTADSSGLVGGVRVSNEELNKLRDAWKTTGDSATDAARKVEDYNKTASSSDKLSASLSRSLIGLAASWVSVRGAMNLVNEYRQEEQAAQKLDAIINSMQRSTQGLSLTLKSLAGQIQNDGILGDEAIVEGASLLAIYGKITDEMLPRTIRVMADLAAFMGGDVTSAARALGMASEGSTDILRRQGIVISETTKQHGDFGAVLDEIENKVGGVNSRLTAGAGQFTQFGNRLSDVKEKLGELIATNPAVRLFSDAFVTSIEAMVDALSNLGGWLAKLGGAGFGGDYFNLTADELMAKRRELEVQLGRLKDEGAKDDSNVSTVWLDKQIAEVEQRLKHVNMLYSLFNQNTASGGGAPVAPPIPDETLKQYDDLIAQLREQNALYGEITNEAKVRYQLENSNLKSLNDAQKELLINEAKSLDLKDAQKQALLDTEKVVKEIQKTLESTHREFDRVQERFERDSADLDAFIADQHKSAAEKQAREMEAQAERQAEIMQRPFKNALDNIQNSFTDFFVNIFNGGINSFSDLAKAAKQIFIRMAAELASMRLFQSLLGGGSSGGMTGGMTSILGMMGGGSGLGSLFGSGSNNVLGMNGEVLGTIPGKVGSMSMLGVGAMGAAGGGILASLLGGNTTGGSIGGSLGSMAGLYLGGPIGAAIGGALGGAVGGMFGGGKSNGTQAVGVGPDGQLKSWGFTGKKFDANLRSAADGIGQQLQQAVAAMTEAVGGELASQIAIEIGNRDQSLITGGGQTIRTRQGDANAALQAALGLAVKNLRGGDADKLATLQDVFNSTGDINSAVQAVRDMDTARQAAEALTSETEAWRRSLESSLDPMKALTFRFEDMRETAVRLGVGLSEVNELHLRALRDMETQTQGQLSSVLSRARSLFSIDQLSSYQSSLLTGDASPLSGMDRFNASRSQLNNLFQAAIGGDLDAGKQFSGLAQQTLSLGRNVFASGSGYQDLFREVNSQLSQVISSQQGQFNATFGPALEMAMRETSQDQVKQLKETQAVLVEELQNIRRELAQRNAA